ncbi:hypothetical protein D3C75_1288710 [compost metagenome]
MDCLPELQLHSRQGALFLGRLPVSFREVQPPHRQIQTPLELLVHVRHQHPLLDQLPELPELPEPQPFRPQTLPGQEPFQH